MSSSLILLDKYVKASGHASDSAAARALKVQPSAVNNWRHGRAHPNAEAVERMCSAINEPLAHWLALIEAERARTPADKRVWLRLAQVAAAITAAFLMFRHGVDTHAISAFVFSPVYIMRNVMARWFGVVFRNPSQLLVLRGVLRIESSTSMAETLGRSL